MGLGKKLRKKVKAITDPIVKPVVNAVKNALNDPVETIATAAGYYFGGPAGAAIANAAVSKAQGDENVLRDAALIYVASSGAESLFGGGSTAGTPGVSEVYPVDMGYTAPGTPIAPISTAAAIPASQAAFPAVEIGASSTPVPGSFQAALPELGVLQQAGATAVPGTFQAALPTLLSPAAAASAFSVSDVLRGARLANNLMGGGEASAAPQRQDIGQVQVGEVDLLNLPRLRARRAGVAGLLSPMRSTGPMFDFYSGQPTSLLG
jgi:hypothetical protein